MFNPKNLADETKINYLIKQNFLGKPPNDLSEYTEYKEYIMYANVVDILDFSRKDFNKSFILSPKVDIDADKKIEPRKLKSLSILFSNLPGKTIRALESKFEKAQSKSTKTLRLNNAEVFDISIGKRVLSKEIEKTKDGIPVYSANVFEPFGLINKKLLTDFDKPSVIWGIDGDWMVNYINENKPFYPTDHCGVIRVKGNDIHPRYLTWALESAGLNVRFSRTHRASIARIKGLRIFVPPIDEQKELIKEVELLEAKIEKSKEAL